MDEYTELNNGRPNKPERYLAAVRYYDANVTRWEVLAFDGEKWDLKNSPNGVVIGWTELPHKIAFRKE